MAGSVVLHQRRLAGALAVLVTVAVTLVLAHEGHAPLPSRGVDTSELDRGRLTVSHEARQALDVRTAEVERRAVAGSLLAYATLAAPWTRHAFASSRLPGRIVKLHVRPGDTVRAGQVLAEVESLELESLQLEILNADNDIHLAAEIVKDLKKSAQSGATPGQQLIEAEVRHRQYRNALQVAISKWFSLGLSRDDLDDLLAEGEPILHALPVRSPIPGTVIHADLTVGRVVEPLEHLFEVVDLSTVWVQIGVLEKDLHRVSVGQPIDLRLTAYPGEVFQARVQVKGYHLDPKTHLNTIWAELSNPTGAEPRFLPGMAGEADLLLPATTSTAVPVEAVLASGADRFVLVEEASTAAASQYQRRNVVLGRQAGGWVEVTGELFPGDRVVTQGGHELAGFFIQGVLRPGPEAVRNLGLETETAAAHVVEEILEMDGAVDVPADRRAEVASPFAGSLTAIRVDRGQVVRPGDVLAELASLELQSLQLELLRAHLDGQLLEDTLKRLRSIKSALPRRRMLETESERNANQLRRQTLTRKLQVAGLSEEQLASLLAEKKLVESLPIRSPIAGVVVRFDGVLGQAVKADQPLFAVHDLRRPLVQAHVSERHVAGVRLGQPVRVRFRGDPSFEGTGKVVRSGRVFGTENRTLAVWVELDRQPHQPLRHGQLARLSLTVQRPPATLAVPLQAVVREGLRSYLFIKSDDGTCERRAVELGRADDRRVEITAGLRPGERVVIRGAAELQTAYAAVE